MMEAASIKQHQASNGRQQHINPSSPPRISKLTMASPKGCVPCHSLVALVLLLGVLLMASPLAQGQLSVPGEGDTSSSNIALRHELWMAKHGRTYTDEVEKQRRLEIFQRNVRFVESFNRRGDHSYTLDVNQFADRTEEELRTANFGVQPYLEMTSHMAEPFKYANVTLEQVPTYKDWRSFGAVNPVKNQGSCGSCWAFATVSATESITKIYRGRLWNLSEQQLVDCSTQNSGCNGGWPTAAFQYIQEQGVTTAHQYPYKGYATGSCQPAANNPAARIRSYGVVPSNNEQALMSAVANQPVAVAIYVGPEFQRYRQGIFTGPCSGQINHAVVLVGYGTAADGTKYWILRNSWGPEWGENGYMRILRGSADARGTCLLAMYPSYPIA